MTISELPRLPLGTAGFFASIIARNDTFLVNRVLYIPSIF